MALLRFGILITSVCLPVGVAYAGDPERGLAVFLDRDLGHCVLCHQVDSLDVSFQGNIGPPLTGVASRLTPAQIRRKIMDPTVDNPDTTMPSYFRIDGLRQVASEYQGRTVLRDTELDDLMAYLLTLKAERP